MSEVIQVSNLTVKVSSIDGVMLKGKHNLAKIYVNGVSIGVTDDIARKIKRILEREMN